MLIKPPNKFVIAAVAQALIYLPDFYNYKFDAETDVI